jgi:hypothetical protein
MSEISFSYEPRPQFQEFHERDNRFSALVCHRRAGKTVACVNDLIARALYTKKKNARYAYVAPFYRQAKDVAWTYLKEFGGDAIAKIRESALRVELINGAWISLYGADNPDALRGLYFDGIILDEYGDCRPGLWSDVVLPALTDRRGWAVFIGTPKGKNHFYELYERSKKEGDWFSMMLKASESGIIDAKDLEEVRALQEEASYQQEFECSFEASVKGSYYNDIFNEHDLLGTVPYDPNYPVSMACDLGRTDSTAMWFWQLPHGAEGPQIIDYYEADSVGLDHYFMVLEAKGYNYDTMWLPHDAVAKTLATSKSTIEQFMDWVDKRWRVQKIPRLSVQHGIDAARKVLPHCTFDEGKCIRGTNALQHYKRRYNEILKAYSDSPLHDWSSHGSDAFRGLALVALDELVVQEATTSKPVITAPEIRLDDLWEDKSSGWRTNIIRI